MRTLDRNKTLIHYANYLGKTPITDEYGNETGEYAVTYTNPFPIRMNVSAARGTADLEQFGINANYTRTMVTDNVECAIDKNSILWVGIDTSHEEVRTIDGEETTVNVPNPHNYVVTSVARSLNSVTYAIKEVVVS